MRNWERRIEIGRVVGIHVRNPRSPLTKPALNSIHRHLTGEFAVKPGLLYTAFAPKRYDLREDVAVEVEGIVPGSMGGWLARLDYGTNDYPEWNASELDAVIEALESVDNPEEPRELEDVAEGV